MSGTRSRMMSHRVGDQDGGPGDGAPDDAGGAPSPRTTIVGGRPPDDDPALPPVPVGIQSLLRLASVDPAFREELVRRRAAVAGAAGIELTASERAILAAIPDRALADMAERMPPPAPPRRAFLRQTAATAVVLLGGAAMADALSACCGADTLDAPWTGDAPERPDVREMEVEGGASPHREPGDDDDSAAPEKPVPRPERPHATRGIQSDRPPRPPGRRRKDGARGPAPREPAGD